MKQLDDIVLTTNQYQALAELQRRLFNEFEIETVVLYGSVARGEADEEADVDLLLLTAQPLTRPMRHKITDAIFEVNLRYDTNFSSLVIDRRSWVAGTLSVLPLRDEILKEGVLVWALNSAEK